MLAALVHLSPFLPFLTRRAHLAFLHELCFSSGEEADKPGLQRGLPPAYRQQWQEWEQQVAAEQQEPSSRAKRARKQRVSFAAPLKTGIAES